MMEATLLLVWVAVVCESALSTKTSRELTRHDTGSQFQYQFYYWQPVNRSLCFVSRAVQRPNELSSFLIWLILLLPDHPSDHRTINQSPSIQHPAFLLDLAFHLLQHLCILDQVA